MNFYAKPVPQNGLSYAKKRNAQPFNYFFIPPGTYFIPPRIAFIPGGLHEANTGRMQPEDRSRKPSSFSVFYRSPDTRMADSFYIFVLTNLHLLG